MENPKIRFKGFTKDWEQRKLSHVLDIVTKRNGEKYGKEEVLSVSDEYGCINQIKFQGRSFAGEDISNYKIVDTGDIIYTRSPLKSKPYGIIKVVGDEIGIVSPLYIVNKVKEGNNSQFIYRVFDSPEKTNKYLSPLVRKGAKNTMNISNDEWLSGKIDVAPSYEEQYQIGLYFDHLDHLITLHQRKCEQTKNLKKYMLQKMFPQNGAKVPEIRFNGFTHDWEQRKLGDLVDRVTRKNQDLVSELPLTISAQYGLIDQNEFFDKRVASKDVSGYYLIENGEFAYNKSTSTDAPWGAIKRLYRYENGVLSTLYIVFGIKENNPVDSDFLVSYYSTNLWHKGIHEIAAEGARNHGLLNIAPADFFETKLMIPQDIEEQKKIGKYFEELERLITLHQQKCEELKKIKKFMLQKMFV